jgi:hypothetical protein
MERVHKIQLWRRIGGDALEKGAELSETYDMTSQAKKSQERKRSFPIKTAEARAVPSESGPAEMPDVNEQVPGEEPKKLPQMGALQPHVDVTSHEPPKLVQEKKAQRLALPSRGLYPLDNYLQVKEAAVYFMNHFKFIPPADRHEYCQNLVKRASELNIVVDDTIEKYGSATYAPDEDIQVCIEARRSNILDETQQGVLDKLAEARFALEPEDFALTLGEFDKAACLDQYYGDIPDPYFTTFGIKKVAENSPQGAKVDPKSSIIIGNEHITRRRLVEFIKNNAWGLQQRFGKDVGEGLQSDPSGIFDSLPRDQKLVIMRMANNDERIVEGIQTA